MMKSVLVGQYSTVARRVEHLSDVQKRAYNAVDASPGITITGLARHLGCSHSTATHHLNTLVCLGLLTREREGRTVHHYVAHHSRDTEVRFRAMLRSGRNRDVVRQIHLQQNDALSINMLATSVGMPFNSLKVILSSMESAGLIHVEQKRGRYRIQARSLLSRAVAALEELEAEEAEQSRHDEQIARR